MSNTPIDSLVHVSTVIGEEPGGVGDPGEELGEGRRRRLVIPAIAQFSRKHKAEPQIPQRDKRRRVSAAQLLAILIQVSGSKLNGLHGNA